MPFDPQLIGHSHLLGYIHGDEPDLPRMVSDAEIVPAKHLRLNRSTPLWRIVDGVPHSYAVLDPMASASVTIRLKKAVTVQSLALSFYASHGRAVPKEVSFEADGKEILRTTVEAKSGTQPFTLDAPATFRELRLVVHSAHPSEKVWGVLAEMEAFDLDGKDVLLSPPQQVPRAQPEETLEEYQRIKAGDPTRPVFMTVTGYFHPHFNKWPEEERQAMYSAYIKATDVVGYDIYPIFGWNKPQWIHLVHDATGLLTQMAGPRPVYAWIETSKGANMTGPLDRQKDVTPQHIRAEVWMAICQGATGIGYFTHIWQPSYKQFGVPEQNRKALREINDQITRLAPAILGGDPVKNVTIETELIDADETKSEGNTTQGKVKLDALVKLYNGQLHVFAVNYDERFAKCRATINISQLKSNQELDVVDEDRSIAAEAGSFTDIFEPLAVHIYRLAPKR